MHCKLLANLSALALCCSESTWKKGIRKVTARAAAHFHCTVWGPAQTPALTNVHQMPWKAFPMSIFPSQRWQTMSSNIALKSPITRLLIQLIHYVWLDCKLFSAASVDLKHHCCCHGAGESPLIRISGGSTYGHLPAFCQFCRHSASLISLWKTWSKYAPQGQWPSLQFQTRHRGGGGTVLQCSGKGLMLL